VGFPNLTHRLQRFLFKSRSGCAGDIEASMT